MSDPINPDHYKSYSVETIDMMVAIYGPEKVATHCELTAFKYRMRAGKKGPVEECLAKEKWYLNKGKELREPAGNSLTKVQQAVQQIRKSQLPRMAPAPVRTFRKIEIAEFIGIPVEQLEIID